MSSATRMCQSVCCDRNVFCSVTQCNNSEKSLQISRVAGAVFNDTFFLQSQLSKYSHSCKILNLLEVGLELSY